jgi:hypothetical protein
MKRITLAPALSRRAGEGEPFGRGLEKSRAPSKRQKTGAIQEASRDWGIFAGVAVGRITAKFLV